MCPSWRYQPFSYCVFEKFGPRLGGSKRGLRISPWSAPLSTGILCEWAVKVGTWGATSGRLEEGWDGSQAVFKHDFIQLLPAPVFACVHTPLPDKPSVFGPALQPRVEVPKEDYCVFFWDFFEELVELTVRVLLCLVRAPSVRYVYAYDEEVERPPTDACEHDPTSDLSGVRYSPSCERREYDAAYRVVGWGVARVDRACVRAPSMRLCQCQNVEPQVRTLAHGDDGQSAAILCRKA